MKITFAFYLLCIQKDTVHKLVFIFCYIMNIFQQYDKISVFKNKDYVKFSTIV